MQRVFVIAAAAAGAVSAASAQNNFLVPDGEIYPWVRGVGESSTYAEWDDFFDSFGSNEPDVGEYNRGLPPSEFGPGVTSLWDLVEVTNNAILTQTDNLYALFGPVSFSISISPVAFEEGGTTTVVLQIQTAGLTADPTSFRLDGAEPVAPVEVLFTQDLGEGGQGGGGERQVLLAEFEVEGIPETGELTFGTLTEFVSLEAVTVDTFLAFGPASCNAADLAEPFGIVNSSDVNAFVAAFLAGEAAADLAEPFTIYNSSDVNAFVAAFLSGCP